MRARVIDLRDVVSCCAAQMCERPTHALQVQTRSPQAPAREPLRGTKHAGQQQGAAAEVQHSRHSTDKSASTTGAGAGASVEESSHAPTADTSTSAAQSPPHQAGSASRQGSIGGSSSSALVHSCPSPPAANAHAWHLRTPFHSSGGASDAGPQTPVQAQSQAHAYRQQPLDVPSPAGVQPRHSAHGADPAPDVASAAAAQLRNSWSQRLVAKHLSELYAAQQSPQRPQRPQRTQSHGYPSSPYNAPTFGSPQSPWQQQSPPPQQQRRQASATLQPQRQQQPREQQAQQTQHQLAILSRLSSMLAASVQNEGSAHTQEHATSDMHAHTQPFSSHCNDHRQHQHPQQQRPQQQQQQQQPPRSPRGTAYARYLTTAWPAQPHASPAAPQQQLQVPRWPQQLSQASQLSNSPGGRSGLYAGLERHSSGAAAPMPAEPERTQFADLLQAAGGRQASSDAPAFAPPAPAAHAMHGMPAGRQSLDSSRWPAQPPVRASSGSVWAYSQQDAAAAASVASPTASASHAQHSAGGDGDPAAEPVTPSLFAFGAPGADVFGRCGADVPAAQRAEFPSHRPGSAQAHSRQVNGIGGDAVASPSQRQQAQGSQRSAAYQLAGRDDGRHQPVHAALADSTFVPRFGGARASSGHHGNAQSSAGSSTIRGANDWPSAHLHSSFGGEEMHDGQAPTYAAFSTQAHAAQPGLSASAAPFRSPVRDALARPQHALNAHAAEFQARSWRRRRSQDLGLPHDLME